MSYRMSARNLCLSVSHEQFCRILKAFLACAEKSFGTACEVEIRAMNRIKMTSSFMHDDDVMDFMDRHNQEAVFASASKVEDFAASVYDRAVYVEAVIRPKNPEAAPAYAFAHMEAKGTRTRQMTFYMQPENAEALHALKRDALRSMLIGDGFDGNT